MLGRHRDPRSLFGQSLAQVAGREADLPTNVQQLLLGQAVGRLTVIARRCLQLGRAGQHALQRRAVDRRQIDRPSDHRAVTSRRVDHGWQL
jgi:hypothetical protein